MQTPSLPSHGWSRKTPCCRRFKMLHNEQIDGDTVYDRYEYTIELFKDGDWVPVKDAFNKLTAHMKFVDDLRQREDISLEKKDEMLDYYYSGLLRMTDDGIALRKTIFGIEGVVLNAELIIEAAMTHGARLTA